MVVQRGNQIVQQRRIRSELRRLREDAGRTQRDIANALGWSTSKVIRLETGATQVVPADLMALLHYYDVRGDRASELLELARAKENAWWDEYESFGQQFINMVAYEDSAAQIKQFQGTVIPGLLQTEEYAKTIIYSHQNNTINNDAGVRARMRRQHLLVGESGPEYFAILDECVLRRQVGGPAVRREQLIQLKKMAERPRVSIRVIPFELGTSPAMQFPFIVYEFADNQDDHVTSLDGPRGYEFTDDVEIVSKHLEHFATLQDIALSEQETISFLGAMLAVESEAA